MKPSQELIDVICEAIEYGKALTKKLDRIQTSSLKTAFRDKSLELIALVDSFDNLRTQKDCFEAAEKLRMIIDDVKHLERALKAH